MCSERFLTFQIKVSFSQHSLLKITGICIHRHQICWLFSVVILRGSSPPVGVRVVPPSSEWHLPLPPFNHGFQALVLFLLLDYKPPRSREFISIYFCIPSLQSLTKYLDRVDTPTTGKIQSNQNQPFDHILIPLCNVWRKENIMDPQNMWFLLSMKSKFRSV